MNNTDIIEKITDKIRGSKNFIVTSHTSPDGDNIGSSIAMTLFLRKLEKLHQLLKNKQNYHITIKENMIYYHKNLKI